MYLTGDIKRLFNCRIWIRIHSESGFRFTCQIKWLRRV